MGQSCSFVAPDLPATVGNGVIPTFVANANNTNILHATGTFINQDGDTCEFATKGLSTSVTTGTYNTQIYYYNYTQTVQTTGPITSTATYTNTLEPYLVVPGGVTSSCKSLFPASTDASASYTTYTSFQCPDFTWNAMPTGTYTLGFSQIYTYQDGPFNPYFSPQVFVVAHQPTTITDSETLTTTATTTLAPQYYGTTTVQETSIETMLTTLPAKPASTAIDYVSSTATVVTTSTTVGPASTVSVTKGTTSVSTVVVSPQPLVTSTATVYSGTSMKTVFVTITLMSSTTVTNTVQSCPATTSSTSKSTSKTSSSSSVTTSSSKSSSKSSSTTKPTSTSSSKSTSKSSSKTSTASTSKSSTKTSSTSSFVIPTPTNFACPTSLPITYTASYQGMFEVECFSTQKRTASMQIALTESSKSFGQCMAACNTGDKCLTLTYIANSINGGNCFVERITSTKRRRQLPSVDLSNLSPSAKQIWDEGLAAREAFASKVLGSAPFKRGAAPITTRSATTSNSAGGSNNGGPDHTYPPFPETTIIAGTVVVNVTKTPAGSAGLYTAYSSIHAGTTKTVTPSAKGTTTTSTTVKVTGHTTVVSHIPVPTVTIEKDTTTTTTTTAKASGTVTKTVTLQRTATVSVGTTITSVKTFKATATRCASKPGYTG